MDKEKIIKSVTNLVKPIIENLGYEFVETTFEEVEGEKILTLIIYSEKGITFDDCKIVTKAVDEPLDELNPTSDQSYCLNVSSLGLDRPLVTKRDFERFLNKDIEIYGQNNKIIGKIVEVTDENVVLKVKNTTKTIKLSLITKAKPYIKF